jgi:hypothetical protein
MNSNINSSASNDEGYNGYSNRQTWTVSLWLDNDNSTYSMLLDWAKEMESQGELADRVKDYIEEGNPLADEASLYSDLLNHAIAMTDWFEVVDRYWNELRGEG